MRINCTTTFRRTVASLMCLFNETKPDVSVETGTDYIDAGMPMVNASSTCSSSEAELPDVVLSGQASGPDNSGYV